MIIDGNPKNLKERLRRLIALQSLSVLNFCQHRSRELNSKMSLPLDLLNLFELIQVIRVRRESRCRSLVLYILVAV